jgi:tyrosine-protein phosphatase SIW14
LPRRVFIALFLALTAAVAPAFAGDIGGAPDGAVPIRRFLQVGPGLYRGGQPDRAGFERLRDLGIRTVVSFRTSDDERALVEALGMTYVRIPVSFRWLGGDLPEQAVARFFEIVDDPARGPVFFHCKRGADRTGAFAALYRIVRQRWSVERAYREAREVGMRWWYPSVRGELRAQARALIPPGA